MKPSIRCITCEKYTPHRREKHHGGEYLWRCVKCGTWTLARCHSNHTGKPLRNPVSSEISRAVKLADDFSGHKPQRVTKFRQATPSKVRLAIGEVTAIQYRARRDGVTNEFRHRFAHGSRPQLSVTPDGKRLELLGGAFRFTERGIVDTPRTSRKKRKT